MLGSGSAKAVETGRVGSSLKPSLKERRENPGNCVETSMILFLFFNMGETSGPCPFVHPIDTIEGRARRLMILMLRRMSVMTASQDAGKEGVRLVLDRRKDITSEVLNAHWQ